MIRIALATAVVLAATAGAAAAAPVAARIDLTIQRPAKPLNLSLATPARGPIYPKTAVERRIGPDGVMGAGFLCGRDSAADYSGASGAYGDDPHGRFVGARLSRSF